MNKLTIELTQEEIEYIKKALIIVKLSPESAYKGNPEAYCTLYDNIATQQYSQ